MLIQLLPIGDLDLGLAAEICRGLSREFDARSEILHDKFDPEPARHPESRQYHSTEILARMAKLDTARENSHRLMGVTPLDLYIPTLTFVFGEAQLEGHCAVISSHRLRQEFYGLPPDAKLLGERLLKEAVHELGHTFGLRHCDDYRCAMAPSHSVEWVDLKSVSLCQTCRSRANF